MRYLTGKEAKEAEKFIKIAAEEAKKSKCRKSQRGVVIVKNGKIIGRGNNRVITEKYCDPCIRENIKDNSRVELCSALHAEQVAILEALRQGKSLKGSRLFHIKVKNGEIKSVHDVSCTVCSRLIIEAGIGEVVLLHKKGFALYDAEEFNIKSFEYFLGE